MTVQILLTIATLCSASPYPRSCQRDYISCINKTLEWSIFKDQQAQSKALEDCISQDN